ncbi:MAG: TlyA family RNA methyltransferase [Candidatus Gracilibacteria bacterium]|nr:TlyA family RNA methyltransferase [Candidatus Gracilibacteria bacterium]
MRLDKYLAEHNLASSRQRAILLIKDGKVKVDDKIIFKPSFLVGEKSKIILLGQEDKYVARSAYKLLKAIEKFDINLKGKICADIGASTGGFCQIMLENGVKKIYAIDVGHSQLHEKIKNNSKIINLEKTNARALSDSIFGEKLNFISIDVSFISLELILPNLTKFLDNSGSIIALIKPQFEVGLEGIGRGGLVKNDKYREKAILKIRDLVKNIGLEEIGFCVSPIKGGDGNIEYLIYLKKSV